MSDFFPAGMTSLIDYCSTQRCCYHAKSKVDTFVQKKSVSNSTTRFFRGRRRRLRPLIEKLFGTFLKYVYVTHQKKSDGLGRRYDPP